MANSNAFFTYVNPWTTDKDPKPFVSLKPPAYRYKGFLVFGQVSRWDFVFNGCCITQRNGAKKFREVIDGLLNGTEYIHGAKAIEALGGK